MKRLFFLLGFIIVVASSIAQETTFFGKVNAFLTKPDRVDSIYLYQAPACFSLGLFGSGQKSGFDVDLAFKLKGHDNWEGESASMLTENLYRKMGVELRYGNIGFAYGFGINPRSKEKRQSFSLNLIGQSWGVKFNYYKVYDRFSGNYIVTDITNHTVVKEVEFASKEPASMKVFSIDGYYVFNHKRFSYPSTYKVKMVQRRTSGSWLLAACYMQGSLSRNPDIQLDTLSMLDGYSTMQVSIGGGYSVNFVLWHKDPIGPRDKGLRNITLNLTAMPMVTLFNYLKTTAHKYNEQGTYEGETHCRAMCSPIPNFIGNAAISASFGRWFFTTQFNYNRFFFRNHDAIYAEDLLLPVNVSDLTFDGSFHDWTLKMMVAYRF